MAVPQSMPYLSLTNCWTSCGQKATKKAYYPDKFRIIEAQDILGKSYIYIYTDVFVF